MISTATSLTRASRPPPSDRPDTEVPGIQAAERRNPTIPARFRQRPRSSETHDPGRSRLETCARAGPTIPGSGHRRSRYPYIRRLSRICLAGRPSFRRRLPRPDVATAAVQLRMNPSRAGRTPKHTNHGRRKSGPGTAPPARVYFSNRHSVNTPPHKNATLFRLPAS